MIVWLKDNAFKDREIIGNIKLREPACIILS